MALYTPVDDCRWASVGLSVEDPDCLDCFFVERQFSRSAASCWCCKISIAITAQVGKFRGVYSIRGSTSMCLMKTTTSLSRTTITGSHIGCARSCAPALPEFCRQPGTFLKLIHRPQIEDPPLVYPRKKTNRKAALVAHNREDAVAVGRESNSWTDLPETSPEPCKDDGHVDSSPV